MALFVSPWGALPPQGEKNKAKVIHPKPDSNGATNLHPWDDHPNVHPNGPGHWDAAKRLGAIGMTGMIHPNGDEFHPKAPCHWDEIHPNGWRLLAPLG